MCVDEAEHSVRQYLAQLGDSRRAYHTAVWAVFGEDAVSGATARLRAAETDLEAATAALELAKRTLRRRCHACCIQAERQLWPLGCERHWELLQRA